MRAPSRCIDKPTKENWTLFYSRGVCNERLKDWPDAEADFKQALQLSPDESLGAQLSRLFLGRSGRAICKQAMDYIRKAVKLKPDDGYYVDSLGWAYYRLGNCRRRSSTSSAPSSSGPTIRSSTIISAMPIGASGASSRRNISGSRR